MNLSTVIENKWAALNSLAFYGLIFATVMTAGLFGMPAGQVFAQSALITESEESSPYDLMETQEGQIGLGTQTSDDILQGGEDELSAFDPSTIPDSSPDGDWIFEVPIKAEQMSDQVRGLLVTCYVGQMVTDEDGTHLEPSGSAKKEIRLTNGSYQGNVNIGVNAQTGDKYLCTVLLVGPDGRAEIFRTGGPTNDWRRIDPEKPHKWRTGFVDLPK